MSRQDYKYEVAFTLVDADKEICRTINNLIKNKINTFTYFENKEEIASKDGLERFYNIFFQESKIVVILLNSKWGHTDFTRKEELAIKNRIVKTDWEFLIIVKLNKDVPTPNWYPLSDLYVDYKEFGAEGVASVIENKARQLGLSIKTESTLEKALRISEERQNLQKISETLKKEYVGIKYAEEEVNNLFKILKSKITQIDEQAKNLYIKITKDESKCKQITTSNYVYNINWWPRSCNYLEGAVLIFNVKYKDVRRGYTTEYKDVSNQEFKFDINPSWIPGWEFTGKFYTSEQLTDLWIDIILNEIEKQNKYIK